MKPSLSVALLSPVYWPEVRRGSERFVRELADGLIARGDRPTLITSHRRALVRTTVEDGLRVIRVPRPPDRRLERRMFEHHLTHLGFSYLALRRLDPDIAHAIYPTDALAAIRWARRTGRPSVLSYMGVAHRRGIANRRGRPEITLSALREADAAVVLSRTAAEACSRWLGTSSEVIHPGADLDAFTPGGARAAEPTIICPAAVDVERKRVGLLVDALEIVRRTVPGARLVLSRPHGASAGSRAGVPGAERLSAPGVELADLDDREQLAAAYRSAWVCALPSLGEAFGLVLVESLACGTPVVGSDDAAIPEVIDDPATGRLFSGDSPAVLAAALLEAFALARRPGTAAACRAHATRFSSAATAERYALLYRRLLAEPGGRR